MAAIGQALWSIQLYFRNRLIWDTSQNSLCSF